MARFLNAGPVKWGVLAGSNYCIQCKVGRACLLVVVVFASVTAGFGIYHFFRVSSKFKIKKFQRAAGGQFAVPSSILHKARVQRGESGSSDAPKAS